jgi:cyclin H
MTDAYFLYTPSQIWFSAFLLADQPLAQFYLETKLGPGAEGTTPGPLAVIREKLLVRLTDCSKLLESYTPLSSDPEKMKSLKRIGKKLYHCQNPEKIDIVGLNRAKKRDSGNSTTGIPPSIGGSGAVSEGVSESEMERVAKKRRLERERREKEGRDLFGGDLVMQRVKQQNAGTEG